MIQLQNLQKVQNNTDGYDTEERSINAEYTDSKEVTSNSSDQG